MDDKWISVEAEKPLWGKDVLVYSIRAKGYAVANLQPQGTTAQGMWINSTNGLPLSPQPTHWQPLPPPPQLPTGSGFDSYSSNN